MLSVFDSRQSALDSRGRLGKRKSGAVIRILSRSFILLLPALIIVCALLAFPLAGVAVESLRFHEAGRVGGSTGTTLSFANYIEFTSPTYIGVFANTFVLSAAAALIATCIGLPIAAVAAVSPNLLLRRAAIIALIAALFLNTITRVYSLGVTLGPAGIGPEVASLFGTSINSKGFLRASIVAGLVHFTLPVASLTLVGTVKNLNPRLLEAAVTLGASRAVAHLTVTVPLCMKGMASAFAVSLTLGLSSFVVPFALGKGRVEFVANLVYRRFSEIANYPAGSALAILLLVATLVVILIAAMATKQRF